MLRGAALAPRRTRAEFATPRLLRAALIDDRAFICTQNAERCDVHDMATLERRKSVVAPAFLTASGDRPLRALLLKQANMPDRSGAEEPVRTSVFGTTCAHR